MWSKRNKSNLKKIESIKEIMNNKGSVLPKAITDIELIWIEQK